MSSYDIQACNETSPVIEAYRKRGFKVVVAAVAWQRAMHLAKSLGMPSQPKDVMVVSTLARQVHQAQRCGQAAFAQPSLVVMPSGDNLHLTTADWNLVREAARQASDEVVFLYSPE